MFFITHVEPVHPLRGTEVRFFLREQSPAGNKSHVVIKEIPHYFCTPPILTSALPGLRQKLQGSPELETLLVEEVKYNRRRSFLRIAGRKEDAAVLPSLFQNISPSQQLRWLYSPTMIVDDPEHIPSPQDIFSGKFRRRYAPLEALVQDSYAVLDIEMEGWEQGKDHIFMAVYLSPHRRIIFHDLPFPQQEQEGFSLESFDSPADLGNKITALLSQEDPLWIYGHNIMKYDQIRMRDHTQSYFPATDGHYPVTKSTQGLGRVITKGRFTLDTYAYHFNYCRLFVDTKLRTLSVKKRPLTAAQQSMEVKAARQGNLEAFQELVYYCIGDGFSSLEVAEQAQSPVSRMARHFRTSPDRVCTTGKTTLAEEYWHRRHFALKGTSWKRWRPPKNASSNPFSLDALTASLLSKGFVRGFIPDVHVLYLTPFIAGCQDIVVRRAAELLEPAPNIWERYALRQALNADLSYLVQEYLRVTENDGSYFRRPPEQYTEKEIARLQGVFASHAIRSVDESGRSSAADPVAFVRQIAATFSRINHALGRYTLVNQGRQLTFLQGDINHQRLEESLSGIYFGSGPVLSLRPGRIIANPLQETNPARFLYQGYGVSAGRKSNFEKRVAKETIAKFFSGESFRHISEYLNQELHDFAAGNKPAAEYSIVENTVTYYAAELRRIIEQRASQTDSSIPVSLVEEFLRLSPRLKLNVSPDTRKMLKEFMAQCQRDFSFPYLEELTEKILHPFPPKMELVIDERGQLVPAPWSFGLGLQHYAQKAQRHFADFYAVLKPAQQELKF